MDILHGVMTAYDAGDEKALAEGAKRYLELLADLDRLLDTQPQHRLSGWIRAARQWGQNAAEQDFYERNARSQVTIWGGPRLYDYAAKEWSGLTADF
jgi:alpha-N-acetylglucosaminidase